MLFNQARALAKMDEYGVDAVVGPTPRKVHRSLGRLKSWELDDARGSPVPRLTTNLR